MKRRDRFLDVTGSDSGPQLDRGGVLRFAVSVVSSKQFC